MNLRICVLGWNLLDVALTREAVDEVDEPTAVTGTLHYEGDADADAADPRYRWPEDGVGFRA